MHYLRNELAHERRSSCGYTVNIALSLAIYFTVQPNVSRSQFALIVTLSGAAGIAPPKAWSLRKFVTRKRLRRHAVHCHSRRLHLGA
jgi:hypothetical protein